MKFKEIFKDSYIQTFDDEKKGRVNLIAQFPMSEFEQREEELKKLNNAGAGIYFTPNPCKGGRKEENVVKIQWIYVDLDGGDKVSQMKRIVSSPIAPHIVVESKNGYHVYFKCNASKIEFKSLVERLIFYFNADPAISSINEVLRMPDFYHVKDRKDPFKIEVVHYGDNPEYHIDDMLEAFPPPEKQTQEKFKLEDDELSIVKDVPIRQVLESFGVEIKRNQVFENGEGTSAMINESQNYITRFSGKKGSGSTIDAAMVYGNMDVGEAIQWLKEKFLGIKKSPIKPVLKPKKDYKKRYTWGTAKLNHTFAIIKRENLIVVYGTRGQGKTTYIFDMAWKNANLGHKVLFFSLEMEREALIESLCRRYAGITIPEEYDYVIPDYKQRAYEERERELNSNSNFIFLGMRQDEDKTWNSILAKMLSCEGLDMIVIDNLDLIAGAGGESNNEKQIRIIQGMAAFVSKYKVPIILLHHQRKFSTGSNKSSGMDDMSGSGKVPDTADYTVRVVRDTDPTLPIPQKYETNLFLEKGRGYSEAMHAIYFCRGTFEDAYSDHAGRYSAVEVIKEIFNIDQ